MLGDLRGVRMTEHQMNLEMVCPDFHDRSAQELSVLAIDAASNYEAAYYSLLKSQMEHTIKSEGFPDKTGWSPQFEIQNNNGEFSIVFTDSKSAGWFKNYCKKQAKKDA